MPSTGILRFFTFVVACLGLTTAAMVSTGASWAPQPSQQQVSLNHARVGMFAAWSALAMAAACALPAVSLCMRMRDAAEARAKHLRLARRYDITSDPALQPAPVARWTFRARIVEVVVDGVVILCGIALLAAEFSAWPCAGFGPFFSYTCAQWNMALISDIAALILVILALFFNLWHVFGHE